MLQNSLERPYLTAGEAVEQCLRYGVGVGANVLDFAVGDLDNFVITFTNFPDAVSARTKTNNSKGTGSPG